MDNNSLSCGNDHCGSCCSGCGGCGSCGGHRGEVEVTQTEVDLLRLFAQIPFLPVARQDDSEKPIFFEDNIGAVEVLGDAITALCQKGLIQLDYNLPLINFDYSKYEQYPFKGSMALTTRGQAVVELLEIQGIEE